MQFNQTFGQRETETGAFALFGLCIQNLPKWLHDSRQIVGTDSRAGILDADFQLGIVRESRVDRHYPALGRELQGI